jgi:phosphoribosyl 1,2-cyclic phosphodiesterase
VFVSGGTTSILVDAGLSGVELERRMRAKSLSPDKLSALVVTHEHTDHIQAAGILSRRYNIPLYINSKTQQAAAAKLGRVDLVNVFACGTRFEIGDLTINPFSISHDAADPLGMTVAHGKAKLGIATDLGIATNLVRQHLQGCHLLYVEANHDPHLLNIGPYPWYLKQRVKSRKGHLSNQEAAALVSDVSTEALAHVILAHLSEQNNCPEKALQAMTEALDSPHVRVEVARPDLPGSLIAL